MNAEQPQDPQQNPNQPAPAGFPGGFTQELQHAQVSARDAVLFSDAIIQDVDVGS